MLPNIDIINDFAALQASNRELGKSNFKLLNQKIQLEEDVRVLLWALEADENTIGVVTRMIIGGLTSRNPQVKNK